MPVSAPYTVTDANTVAVEVTFKWRVVVPSDTSLAVAPPADFKDGAYPSGSGVIAANAVSRATSWTLETVPNLVVTNDRYFDVEVYDVLPADANLTNMRVRTKLTEDDVSTELEPNLGPVSTADTKFVDTKKKQHTLRATVVRVGQLFQFAIDDADGLARLEIEVASDAVIEGYYYPGDGSARARISRLQHGVTGGIVGKIMVVNYRATDNVLITVGGVTVHDGGFGYGAVGTGARIVTGGEATPDAQINPN